MKKTKLAAIILIVVSTIITIVSYFVLPETVITQFGASGNSTMPKLAAIAFPFVLGAGGAGVSLSTGEDDNAKRKCFIVSVVGIAAAVLILVVNLRQ